jgi:flagellar basal body-associated protein FliL
MFDEIKPEGEQGKKNSDQELNQKSAPSFNTPPSPSQAGVNSGNSSPEKSKDFEVPELIKKDTLKKVEDSPEKKESTSSQEEKIYVMPDKFKQNSGSASGGKSKKGVKIFLIIFFVILIGGGSYYYFWAQRYIEPEVIVPEEEIIPEEAEEEEVLPEEEEIIPEEAEEEEVLPEEEEIIPEEAEEELFKETNLEIEVKDQEDKLISKLSFHLPEGSLGAGSRVEVSGTWDQEQAFQGDDLYTVLGAIYEINSDTDLVFLKTVNLEILYNQELVEDFWEDEITLGYLKNETWTPLISTVDSEENIARAELDFLPANTIGLIVEKDKLIPEIEKLQIAPHISSSLDDDNDGLTNIEESVFSSESNNPDTDADEIPDGQEVLNLSNPLQPDNQLSTSGLVKVYINPTFSYSLFYPSSWLTRPIPETENQEVLIVTNTGEFFSINVENNPEELNPTDWYLRQSPNLDAETLLEVVVHEQPAVWSADRLTIYVARQDKIYLLSYLLGTSSEANFKTTFQMMINSFQFVTQPQGRANGTLIKYPNQPEVYLIENNKKRAFVSGEVFERLGFKWEDVIEIPLEEEYEDGPPIESAGGGVN